MTLSGYIFHAGLWSSVCKLALSLSYLYNSMSLVSLLGAQRLSSREIDLRSNVASSKIKIVYC